MIPTFCPTLGTQNDLSQANTMALCCLANTVISVTDENQLITFLAAHAARNHANTASKQPPQPLFILSGGSNVLLPTQLQATVLCPKMLGIQVTKQTKNRVDIEVMAGENWHDLVVYTVNQGWYGLENLALIPGLIGAAPVQNIGAYGIQLENYLHYVRAYHLPTQTWHHLTAKDCEFGYRDSLFKRAPNQWVISRVGLSLHTDATQVLANYGDVRQIAQTHARQNQRLQPLPIDVMNAIIEIRQKKLPDPKQMPNCGSFFQNPIIDKAQFLALQQKYPSIVGYSTSETSTKVAAGWLIEHAGLKGGGIAPILTHQQQALVLTNHQPYQATQNDVANTQNHIARCVSQKFAITLAREPVWVNTDGSIGTDAPLNGITEYDEHVV